MESASVSAQQLYLEWLSLKKPYITKNVTQKFLKNNYLRKTSSSKDKIGAPVTVLTTDWTCINKSYRTQTRSPLDKVFSCSKLLSKFVSYSSIFLFLHNGSCNRDYCLVCHCWPVVHFVKNSYTCTVNCSIAITN